MADRTSSVQSDHIRVMLVFDGDYPQAIVQRLGYFPELKMIGAFRANEVISSSVQKLRPQIILLNLPMSAVQLLRDIDFLHAMLPELGIGVLSPPYSDYYRKLGLAYGADEVLSHDTLNTELVPALQRMMQKQAGQHPRFGASD